MSLAPAYIIVSLRRGPSASPVRHTTLNSAIGEARRLAITSPDDSFDIFVSVKRVSAPRVMVEDFDPTDDDIPF